MKISKTKLRQIIRTIEKSKKKVYIISDLSNDLGIKDEFLKEFFSDFNPLIYFDTTCNLRDYLDELNNLLTELEKEPIKKRQVIRQKELSQYENFVDYIYKHMTVGGGILDTGYLLNKKDIKILKKLLKEEEQLLKENKNK